MRKIIPTMTLALLAALCGLNAVADTLEFSGELSDGDAPITYFNATIDYEYRFDAGLGDWVFELTLSNLSSPAYTISEVFFNVSDDVTGLSLVDNGGMTGAELVEYDPVHPSRTQAGGFGDFDWKIDLGRGNTGLASGGVVTFLMDAEGAGISTEDFFSGLSWDGGLTAAVGAVKFTQGPDDDSVYAIPKETIIPEPASLILLGTGLAAFALRKRVGRIG